MDVELKMIQFVSPSSRISDDGDIGFINNNSENEMIDENCIIKSKDVG